MKLRIGWDLDGCIAQWVQGMRQKIQKDFLPSNKFLTYEPCRWPLWECWGIDKAEFTQHFTNAVEQHHMFLDCDPYPGGIEAVHAIAEKGHSLHVVTDRGMFEQAPTDTIKWLKKHGIYDLFSSITFTGDKSVVNLDILIDDYYTNCEVVSGNGVYPILIDRPWNRVIDDAHACQVGGWGLSDALGKKRISKFDRAMDWKDVVGLIDKHEENLSATR